MGSRRRTRSARWIRTGAACVGALGFGLCLPTGCADRETPHVDAAADVREAVAVLEPTRNSRARGTVEFEAVDDGVRIHADVGGLPPGRHAFHVHENGDCSAPDATSAGEHFNFASDARPQRITGNLGELDAGVSGQAVFETLIRRAEMGGERSILGRAVVVHERGNDPSALPDGDAGARIACGVISSSRDTHS